GGAVMVVWWLAAAAGCVGRRVSLLADIAMLGVGKRRPCGSCRSLQFGMIYCLLSEHFASGVGQYKYAAATVLQHGRAGEDA
ncbi:hypothetical protein, partial [Paractinoplanes hotanensis]